jgi:2-oxoglutarate dehydrogenase E1 component
LFCSGKVYYDLLERKISEKRSDVAIVRLEQMYPFPKEQFEKITKKYKTAEFVWVQEEPVNMGPYQYVLSFYPDIWTKIVSRKAAASPATGYKKVHDAQQADIVDRSFA